MIVYLGNWTLGKIGADFWQDMCESAWKWQSNNPYGYEEGEKDAGHVAVVAG